MSLYCIFRTNGRTHLQSVTYLNAASFIYIYIYRLDRTVVFGDISGLEFTVNSFLMCVFKPTCSQFIMLTVLLTGHQSSLKKTW